VDVRLLFARPGDARPDREHPGVLRVATNLDDDGTTEDDSSEPHLCRVHDLSAPSSARPDLVRMGFDLVHLGDRPQLQRVLGEVARAGVMTESQARSIRRALLGRALPLAGGAKARVLHVASEGMIVRTAGPNGLRVEDRPITATNHHQPATSIHGDQDVYGTPLRQILRGWAPRVFRHDSPQGANHRSPLFVVNLWIPLRQITRPLVLMDRRTLDKRRHQTRYALPVGFFPGRRADLRVNDIWRFLHDDAQRWYFSSEMDARSAYVFDTLGMPHGSCVLPGEEVAEDRFLRIRRALAALASRDAGALRRAAEGREPGCAAEAPGPLREAIGRMDAVLTEAAERAEALCLDRSGFAARATEVADRVVRRSIEMRCLVLVTPGDPT